MSPDPCKHKITNHIDNTQGRYRIYRYRNIQQIHPMIDLKFNKKIFLLDYIDGFKKIFFLGKNFRLPINLPVGHVC